MTVVELHSEGGEIQFKALQDVKKYFKDVHFDVKIYWILPASLWNSTMVITLLPSLPSYSSLLHTAEQEMSQGVFFLNCVLESSKKNWLMEDFR